MFFVQERFVFSFWFSKSHLNCLLSCLYNLRTGGKNNPK